MRDTLHVVAGSLIGVTVHLYLNHERTVGECVVAAIVAFIVGVGAKFVPPPERVKP